MKKIKKNLLLPKKNADFNLIGPLKIIKMNCDFKAPSILIDGGYRHYKLFNKIIYTVGDADSIRLKKIKLDKLLHQDKNQNDFAFALDFLQNIISSLNKEHIHVHLHGLSNGKHAHQQGNLFELSSFIQKSKKVISIKQNSNLTKETFYYISANQQFNIKHLGKFSVYPLPLIKTKIKSSDLIRLEGKIKYQGSFKALEFFSSLGLNNISFGEIKIFSSIPLFIILDNCRV